MVCGVRGPRTSARAREDKESQVKVRILRQENARRKDRERWEGWEEKRTVIGRHGETRRTC